MEASVCASIELKIGKNEPEARKVMAPEVGGLLLQKKI
jgi:hypothetical protein